METLLKWLPVRERSAWLVAYQAESCNLVELLARIVGESHQREVTPGLVALSWCSLMQILRTSR